MKTIINKSGVSPPQSVFKIGDRITENPGEICEHFNDFFINVGPNLSKKIVSQSKDITEYMSRSLESIFLSPVTKDDILKNLNNLKEGSPGWDGLPAKMVKLIAPHICSPLVHLSNLSLTEGVFPDELKIARVIPIYKSKDPMVFGHYRPVSVLPIFSKVLEKIMYSRLIDFFNKHNTLYKYQFGFRNNHSTYMALILLIDKITNAIENGDCVIGIFLDFSKAFDTIDHAILLQKLEMLGIRGIAHTWLQSYLSNRYQYVHYNNETSSVKKIVCGVP